MSNTQGFIHLYHTNYIKKRKYYFNKDFLITSIKDVASGNFSFLGGPFLSPDQIFILGEFKDFWIYISKDPRGGFPLGFNWSDSFVSVDKSSQTSLYIVWPLFLKTDQETQCSIIRTGSVVSVSQLSLGFFVEGSPSYKQKY